MSNTYLSTAFEIRGDAADLDRFTALTAFIDMLFEEGRTSPPEAPAVLLDLLPDIAAGPLEAEDAIAKLSEMLEHEVQGPTCAKLVRATPTIIDVSGEHSPDVDLLAACIRLTCPSALPMGFTFAITSDRPGADAFGGGYLVVSKYGVDGMNVGARMEAELAALRRETALSEIQQVALNAYDTYGEIRMIAEDAGTHRLPVMIKNGEVGDSLVLFILNEASDAEDDFEEGARMMERAAEQLNDVAEALRARSESA